MNSGKSLAKHRLITTSICIGSLLFGAFLGAGVCKVQYQKYDDENFQKVFRVYDYLKNTWYYSKDYEDFDKYMTELAIQGMTNGNKDPYCFYTPTYEQQGLNVDAKGMGIAHTLYGGHRIITHVFDDSPAQKSGLKKGDIILGIYESQDSANYTDFSTLSVQETLDAFSKTDDEIKLKVNQGGVISDLTITKDIYVQNAISYEKFVNGDENVLKIDIQNFLDGNMINDFVKVMDDGLAHFNNDVDRLIIDLRDNGGGRTDYANYLASLFVPEGSVICKYEFVDGTIIEETAHVLPRYEDIANIVILQNFNSASASEMFTLALKDNLAEKVKVVGTSSYGKGIRQSIIPLGDGSFIRVTDAKVLSPNGYCIHDVGIRPDVEINFDQTLLNYYGEIGFVSKEYQEKILNQINVVLDTTYDNYQVAVDNFILNKGLLEEEFNYVVGRALQIDCYNLYISKMNEISLTALEV